MGVPEGRVTRFRLGRGQGIPALDNFHEEATLSQQQAIRSGNVRTTDDFPGRAGSDPLEGGRECLLWSRHRLCFALNVNYVLLNLPTLFYELNQLCISAEVQPPEALVNSVQPPFHR